MDNKKLVSIVDYLKNKITSLVVVLGSVVDGKVILVAGVTKDLTLNKAEI